MVLEVSQGFSLAHGERHFPLPGQILDYFIWQITFMTVQSLAFVLMAASAKDTHLRDNDEGLSSI